MSTEETRRLALNYLDVLNRTLDARNIDLLDGIAAADFVEYAGDGVPGVGIESWKQNVLRSSAAFPDARMTVRVILADGDRAAIHAVLTGTHLGEGLGIPPTGKKVTLDYVDIVRFKGGLAVERWLFADTAALMTQLGVTGESAV